MEKPEKNFDLLSHLIDELIAYQRNRLLKVGERFIPNLTTDDILQPCDFPILENSPIFRYEEGVLEGILTVKTTFERLRKEHADTT